MSVLQVKNLKKSFWKGFVPRKHEVLRGVSFQLRSGTITGFLGGNGAGKTTTLKSVLGLTSPDQGEIRFFESEPLSLSVKRRLGFLPERPYFYDYLSGYELLLFYGLLTQSWSKSVLRDRIHFLLKKMDLFLFKDQPLKSYSKGMLQKLGMAQALLHEPELLILDEPMSGLDPDGRWAVADIIKDIAQREASVFFSSHLLHDVEALCDEVVIIKKGKIVHQGRVDDLLAATGGGYQITFSRDNGSRENLICENVELMNKVDELRKRGDWVSEIKPLRPSLEEVFVQMGLEERVSCEESV